MRSSNGGLITSGSVPWCSVAASPSGGIVGILGGVAASRIGLKLGRALPTLGSFLMLGMLSWQLMHSPNEAAFLATYPCWVILHWFCYSYVMGLSVLVDPLGRLATVVSATYILTSAAGAGIAGLFTRYGGLSSFGWGALGICALGAGLSALVLRGYGKLGGPVAASAVS